MAVGTDVHVEIIIGDAALYLLANSPLSAYEPAASGRPEVMATLASGDLA